MANLIKITCPSCGHDWYEDLDKHQVYQVIYKEGQPQPKIEEYRFQCPIDDTYVIVSVDPEG